MANWFTPIGISALCLITACGSNPPQAQDNPTAAPTELKSVPKTATSAADTEPQQLQANNTATDAPSTPVALQDTTIVPGERVGPVTGDTSRTELAEIFGEAALKDTEVPVGEGFTESGTTVNAGSEQAFSVVWVDSSQSQPATVKDFGPAWQTPEGIQIGTSFAELASILGDFDLYGFGWDYGGTVVLEGSDLSNYYGSLILRLQPTDPSAVDPQTDAFQAVQGDKLIASDNPNLPKLDLSVNEMIVYLNPPLQ